METFKKNRFTLLLGLAIAICLLLGCMTASVLFGLQQFGLQDVWKAYSDFDGSNEHLIITNTRVPRALIAAVVGASLAIAGSILQVLTKNPLASPSVFGINAGAVLFLVISITLFGSALTLGSMIWIAFAGAALTAVFVFMLGSQGRGGFEPVKLTLAGACIAAFAGSVSSGIILIDKQSLDSAMFWMIGSVADRKLEHLYIVLPYVAVGWILALLLSASLNVAALGDDTARGLGQKLMLVRVIAVIAVVLMAGGSVAVAGPIAFVGVIVPHLCRYIAGNDHRVLLPYCGVVGALLLVAADLASRFVIMPKEVPVGVATALLGVPFLIYAARRRYHA
jgi:iron complex transport system permease protein